MKTDVRGPAVGTSSADGTAPRRMYRPTLDEVIVVAPSENPYVFRRNGDEIEVSFTPMIPTLLDRDAARQLEGQGVLMVKATEGAMWRRQRLVGGKP